MRKIVITSMFLIVSFLLFNLTIVKASEQVVKLNDNPFFTNTIFEINYNADQYLVGDKFTPAEPGKFPEIINRNAASDLVSLQIDNANGFKGLKNNSISAEVLLQIGDESWTNYYAEQEFIMGANPAQSSYWGLAVHWTHDEVTDTNSFTNIMVDFQGNIKYRGFKDVYIDTTANNVIKGSLSSTIQLGQISNFNPISKYKLGVAAYGSTYYIFVDDQFIAKYEVTDVNYKRTHGSIGMRWFGTQPVIAYNREGSKFISHKVYAIDTILEEIQTIEAVNDTLRFNVGDRTSLDSLYTITPSTATFKDRLTYKVNHSEIAAIENNELIAKTVGTTDLTITERFTNISTVIKIQVIDDSLNTIQINGTNAKLYSKDFSKDGITDFIFSNNVHVSSGVLMSKGTLSVAHIKDFNATDYYVETRINWGTDIVSSVAGGIDVRFSLNPTDNTKVNGYSFRIKNQPNVGYVIEYNKVANGVYNDLKFLKVIDNYDPNKIYTLGVAVIGFDFYVYLDGEFLADPNNPGGPSVSDASQAFPTGGIGFRWYAFNTTTLRTGIKMYDLNVYDLTNKGQYVPLGTPNYQDVRLAKGETYPLGTLLTGTTPNATFTDSFNFTIVNGQFLNYNENDKTITTNDFGSSVVFIENLMTGETKQITLSVTDLIGPVITLPNSIVDHEIKLIDQSISEFNPINFGIEVTDNFDTILPEFKYQNGQQQTSELQVALNWLNTGHPINLIVFATDLNGNNAEEIIKLIPIDTTSPIINGVSNEEIIDNDVVNFNPLSGVNATDNFDLDITSRIIISYVTDGETETTDLLVAKGWLNAYKMITVKYTVADTAGHSVTVQKTVTPKDQMGPVINGVANKTINDVDINGFDPLTGITATDRGVNVTLSVTFEKLDGTNLSDLDSAKAWLNQGDALVIVYRAVDASNNETVATSRLTPKDTTAPEILGVSDKTLNDIDVDQFDPLNGVSATDKGVVITITVSYQKMDGSTLLDLASAKAWLKQGHVMVIKYQAKDGSNNNRVVTSTVTPLDTIKPLITLINETIDLLDTDLSNFNPLTNASIGLVVTDNFGGNLKDSVVLSYFQKDGTQLTNLENAIGYMASGKDIVIKMNVQDQSGNTAIEKSVIVAIKTIKKPTVISASNSYTYSIGESEVNWKTLIEAKDGFNKTITINDSMINENVDMNTEGTYSVIYTVVDTYGNETVYMLYVNVEKNVPNLTVYAIVSASIILLAGLGIVLRKNIFKK